MRVPRNVFVKSKGRSRTSAGPAARTTPLAVKCCSAASILILSFAAGPKTSAAADLPLKAPPAQASSAYDWSGAYIGGHLGYVSGNSNWNDGPGVAGSLDLTQPIDVFTEGGSFFAGLQAGYDKMLANRFVIGAVADVSFPAWPNIAGVSVGGTSSLVSPAGPDSYSDAVLSFGTVRGRVGYAPGNWLVYATGGLAWSYDQLSLASASETPQRMRLGWAAGAGVEVPVADHWTANLEYLYTQYGQTNVLFASVGQQFTSTSTMQELRAGLNYHFGDSRMPIAGTAALPSWADSISLHGQATFVWQGHPPINSPYQGQNSLLATSEGDETADVTLFAGAKLWRGAEFWFNPEIDQGFGFANTHGAAGFPSGESYKLGAGYPYARVQRAFVRQTIDLGGETEKVDEDINQFAGSHTTDRLVLTVGRFGVNDIFDTNKYANNPKTDFLNWTLINTGTFDYAGDAWGMTYGAAAEWYVGHWTVRAGVFDLSATPAGGNSPTSYGLDPTFSQLEAVAELERRYELWGQPGTIKVTGFLNRGEAGQYSDATALAQATGQAADITAVRGMTNRPGVSANLAQQITDSLGVFARVGWADGNVEPWDFTDVDSTAAVGSAISGKLWGRPDDTIGIAGIVNDISAVHTAFLNAGGIGILVGDGQLPNPRPEQILETYYSYATSAASRLSFDYQFIANPAYNGDRGPVNVVSVRLHGQF
ncbi:carbohydrate porin [Bradyrhizobium sp.]|uniref:carbohydrate porin n=1 Tax=Bradyrhizobium sp. TaxID=376 RepID=UPI003C3A40F6